MTKIKDIVSINDRAVFSNAIQLAWYADEVQRAENDRLVSGYVFGNGIDKSVGNHKESSSLPVFEKIRDVFGNQQASNIFTVVARYGHGKSHFALVLANYFGLAPDSPVVADIIAHIETCSNKPTADGFRNFKTITTRPQLVVTLAGIDFQDLRQGFLQALRRALDAHETTRHLPIKSVSAKAAEWVKNLTGDALERADEFLNEKHDTDVDSLAAALDAFESGKEVVVKDLSRIFNNGYAIDFGADANLKEIIKDTVDTLCAGPSAPFYGMLILFDELGVYADKWCKHPAASGGLAPQEIFEACLDRPGKVCFVGFVQRELGEFVKDSSPEKQMEFQRWAGRMHTDAVYHLVSNLEEVISKLLVKKPEWKQITEDFSSKLLEESAIARESINRYLNDWDANNFYKTIGRDCFPLHPMTTGLLCSFTFTQGSRSIISAVDSLLKSANEKEVSDGGKLQWIRPVELVREFEQAFTQNKSRAFEDYKEVVETALTTDTEPLLLDVLRALFLFKEARMTKQNKYEHAQLLAHLAGHTLSETKEALERLQKDFEAVRYSAQKREYEFSDSVSSRKIVLEMANKAIVGERAEGFVKLLEKLKAFETIENSPAFDPKNNSAASEFKADFAVEGDEWFLAARYMDAERLSVDEVKRVCKKTIDEGVARGTVIYLISGSSAELNEARTHAETVFRQLKEETYAHPFIFAVPTEAAVNLEKQILIKDFIDNKMSQPDKVRFNESHRSAREYTNKELNDELVAHLRTAEYIVPEELSLKFGNRRKSLDEIADALFTAVYKFRAPSNSVSMRPNATTGNTTTALIARQLIVNNLNFQSFDTPKQNVIKQVLTEGTNKWGILDANYKIRDPKDSRVMQAWSFLNTSVSSKTEWKSFEGLISKLVQPPYGYDEYTATFLIAAWIGKHKHELAFKDNRIAQPIRGVGNLPQNGAQANLRLNELQSNLNKSKEFIKLLRSFVSVRNSGDETLQIATDYLAQLQTIRDISEAEQLLEQREQILQPLAAGNELIVQIDEAWENLKRLIGDAEDEKRELAKFRRDADDANDISDLLRMKTLLDISGRQNGIQSSAAFVATRKLVEDKIENLAERESRIDLQRIESYDALRDKLEKSRQALNQAARVDLEALFVSALERLENRYRRLQTEADERPLLGEINAVRINGISLFNLSENLARTEQILETNSSENIAQAARLKKNQLTEQIKNLRLFVEQLPSRVEAIKDIGAAENLRLDVYQKQSKYEDTPEAEIIVRSLESLSTRISQLKTERKQRIEEDNERRRREVENLTARKIAEEFDKIDDGKLRFEILEKILESSKNAGLSDEQKMRLQGILN